MATFKLVWWRFQLTLMDGSTREGVRRACNLRQLLRILHIDPSIITKSNVVELIDYEI